MAAYTDIYKISDLILSLYINHERKRYSLVEIQQSFKGATTPDNIRSAWTTLISDGYLKYDPITQQEWTIITGEGEQFIQEGGYQSHFAGKDAAQLRQIELERATIKMSSALTKTSEAVEADIKSNSRLYIATLFVGVISAAATVRSCQNSYEETKLQKLLEVKDSLIQSQQQSINRILGVHQMDSILIDSLRGLNKEKTKQ